MAEANPKPLPNDGGDPLNKRNQSPSATTAGDSPTKHPDENSGSYEDEFEDTASSKPKNEEIEEVDMGNIEIMQEILEYRDKNVGCEWKTPQLLRRYYYSYILLGIGNTRGWIKKMEEIENKFNSESDPVDDVDKEEFELWNKIWGKEEQGDDDPGVGSSK